MPTVFTLRNIRVVIYANDHPPPHVHVVRRYGARARFELNCPNGPVVLVEQIGLRATDIAELGPMIAADLSKICAQWRTIHG